MAPGELSYFFIRKVAFTLLQEASRHHPAFLPLLRAPCRQDLVQRRAGVSSKGRGHALDFKREVPGSERREAQRQAEFEARYCETETEYCSTKTDEEDSAEEV